MSLISMILLSAISFYIGWEIRSLWKINRRNGIIDNARLNLKRKEDKSHGKK
jgi:hypothetical protein